MLFAQIISFILVMMVFETYQPQSPELTPLESLAACLGTGVWLWLGVRVSVSFFLRRLYGPRPPKDPARSARRLITYLHALAVFFLIIMVTFLDIKAHLLSVTVFGLFGNPFGPVRGGPLFLAAGSGLVRRLPPGAGGLPPGYFQGRLCGGAVPLCGPGDLPLADGGDPARSSERFLASGPGMAGDGVGRSFLSDFFSFFHRPLFSPHGPVLVGLPKMAGRSGARVGRGGACAHRGYGGRHTLLACIAGPTHHRRHPGAFPPVPLPAS